MKLNQVKLEHGAESDPDEGQLSHFYKELLKSRPTTSSVKDQAHDSAQRSRSRSRSRDIRRRGAQRVKLQQLEDQAEPNLFKYPVLPIDLSQIPGRILRLPIYKKQTQILETILKNQIVVITGNTGCGKSTQVPRILYQYLLAAKMTGKILCVQPRRLATLNLEKILSSQIKKADVVSHQIAMSNTIRHSSRIVFMTNGIFLQRFIHDCEELLREYPFIILDEVHERDIDTDFILLGIKHVIRNYPRVRVVLMSATIDNQLFQYYFSQDHIARFLKESSLYLRCMQMTFQNPDRERKENEKDRGDSDHENEEMKIQQRVAMDFMNSKRPCPSISIDDQGSFSKTFYYLDDVEEFLQKRVVIEWAAMMFTERYPKLEKELTLVAMEVIEKIFENEKKLKEENPDSTFTILIFLPGIAEIQLFCSQLTERFKCLKDYNVIQLHSSTVTPEISHQINELNPSRPRLIVATNIAESSITVMGVKYIIDYCMSKEIQFNNKTRLQNLMLIWCSKASCQQRAGRTGRVCDGIIIRLVEKEFYEKFAEFSTPEMQRCSLEKLILRTKLLHSNEKRNQVDDFLFNDPGMVLGRAIQPPSLKNIDSSLKSVIFNGGIELREGNWEITDLGRLYLDLPVDVIYARLLIISLLLGTFDDMLILVSILQQSRSPFKRAGVQKRFIDYWQMIQNDQLCDFYSLIQIYHSRKNNPHPHQHQIQALNHKQIKLYADDILKRISKLDIYRNRATINYDSELRFKLTIWTAFFENSMRAYPIPKEDRNEKRVKQMEERGIAPERTLVINSAMINLDSERKYSSQKRSISEQIESWKRIINTGMRFDGDQLVDIIPGYQTSQLVFSDRQPLYKILFCRKMEKYADRYEDEIKKEEEEEEQQIPDPNKQPTLFESTKFTRQYTSEVFHALNYIGDVELLQQSDVYDMRTNLRVSIDNLSFNRVISSPNKKGYQYLVTNSKIERDNGTFCRYTSMLPDQFGLLSSLYLMFYSYLTIKPDEKYSYYETISLQNSTKHKIGFCLNSKLLTEINNVREIVQRFFNLNPPPQHEVNEFWPMMKGIIEHDKDEVIDERTWQNSFLSDMSIPLNQSIVQKAPSSQSKFMDPIILPNLRQGYFSFEHLDYETYVQHIKSYNLWKRGVLSEIKGTKFYIDNTETNVCCRRCGVFITRLKDISGLCNQMRNFSPLFGSMKEAPQNYMDEFTEMLTTYDFKAFSVYSCINGHNLAVLVEKEEQFKLFPFSEVQIVFPNKDIIEVEFDRLDYKNFEKRAMKALREKVNSRKEIECKICNTSFNSTWDMDKHLKTLFHEDVLKEFCATMYKYPEAK